MIFGSKAPETDGDWLTDWDPEDPEKWDSSLAWRTLSITTFALVLAFASWFVASAVAPKLTALGFDLTSNQLYWLVALPGLSGGALRILWMLLPPVMGTRRLVTLTTALLLLPLIGWGIAVQNPETSYAWLLALAFISGVGGGAFSGFMPSTSYFFPRRLQGTALGIQAGIGNFGVSLVQFLTPWVIGFSMFGFLGGPLSQAFPGRPDQEVWYQNAAFIYVPFVVLAAVLAWSMLRSVPVKAKFRQQLDIFANQDTYWMTFLYILTFGTFAGLSAQFGLLINNLYGSANPEIARVLADGSTEVLIPGYDVPDPINYAFLGPLIGAGARVLFSPLTDRFGGAPWTLISAIGLLGSILFTSTQLSPDIVAGAGAVEGDFNRFVIGMLFIFLFAGIGNASTFKQMPMIFERRQAGGVLGWTAAVAAFGPFVFGVGLTLFEPRTFYLIGVAYAAACIVIIWMRYARPGAPKPS